MKLRVSAVFFLLATTVCLAQPEVNAPSNDVVQAVKDLVSVLQKYGLPFDARAACDAAVDAVIQVADPQGREEVGEGRCHGHEHRGAGDERQAQPLAAPQFSA